MTQRLSQSAAIPLESNRSGAYVDPFDPDGLRTDAFHVLAQARASLDRRMASELFRWGISTIHFQMLDFIFTHGRCTPSQCAYELYISGSAVSRLIGQLEKKQLLVPQNKGVARRQFVLRLSSKGKSAYGQASKALSSLNKGGSGRTPIQELTALDMALRKLAEVLQSRIP